MEAVRQAFGHGVDAPGRVLNRRAAVLPKLEAWPILFAFRWVFETLGEALPIFSDAGECGVPVEGPQGRAYFASRSNSQVAGFGSGACKSYRHHGNSWETPSKVGFNLLIFINKYC